LNVITSVGIVLVPPCHTLTCLQLCRYCVDATIPDIDMPSIKSVGTTEVIRISWRMNSLLIQNRTWSLDVCVFSCPSSCFISNATSWYKYSQTKHRQFFNFWKFRQRTMLLVPGNLLCLTLVNIDRLPNNPWRWHLKWAPLIFYTFKVAQLTMWWFLSFVYEAMSFCTVKYTFWFVQQLF